ncbi:FIST signal transduction protein [Ectothiorhodospira shaposhnikovii]|uniref:FIST signal transduction protein n=2 Tax=Ectothiorhodospiraceae TaxID=72276 RepID=UPI001EE8232B|nr:FIST C-terminal domain-containing protein [Ectothiorhodospira shaposhnikovii]MCG5512971.1 FIST C-terminal domain-containing protein [Ectothiorhodospira shaposhnikovii]
MKTNPMITNTIHFHMEPTGHLDALVPCLQRMAREPGVESIMVLGCDQDNWPHEGATRLFRECPLPVFGGVFPQIIHERKPYSNGTLLVGLPVTAQIAVVHGLSDAHADLDRDLAQAHAAWPEALENNTVIVFLDGFSSRISALIESLFLHFGLDVNFVGGGAGSLSFEKKPCIITPNGICRDTAVLARIPLVSRIGVTHGWEPISDTLKVTSSERNIIHTLDWQPAFEVYRRMIREHGGQDITRENFFDIAKAYPFGISKLDSEMVVRDPLMVVGDQSLMCVGEVREGCFVRLLNGTPDSLIQAATQARAIAESQCTDGTAAPALFIDCISRVLFLGEGIHRELEGAGAGMPLFGAFTLGEIANTGNDYMEFMNKSSVLCLLDMAQGGVP